MGAFGHRNTLFQQPASPGKEPFSIAKYFRKLGGSNQMTVVEAQIDADGAHLETSRGTGQTDIKVVRLEDVMTAMRSMSQTAPVPLLKPQPTPKKPRDPTVGFPVWLLPAAGLLLIGIAWGWKARWRRALPSATAPAFADATPAELHVQEFEYPENQPGQSPKLRQDGRVAIRRNMPVLFGAIPCVAPLWSRTIKTSRKKKYVV